MSATDLSLILVGVLLIMVLLEIRKLSRRREPDTRLAERSGRVERPASPGEEGTPPLPEAGPRRLEAGLTQVRGELAAVRELIEAAGLEDGETPASVRSAGTALRRIDAELERLLSLPDVGGSRG